MLLRERLPPSPLRIITERLIPASPQLFQRVERRGESFALVDPRQHFVVAGFRADIDQRKAELGQLRNSSTDFLRRLRGRQ